MLNTNRKTFFTDFIIPNAKWLAECAMTGFLVFFLIWFTYDGARKTHDQETVRLTSKLQNNEVIKVQAKEYTCDITNMKYSPCKIDPSYLKGKGKITKQTKNKTVFTCHNGTKYVTNHRRTKIILPNGDKITKNLFYDVSKNRWCIDTCLSPKPNTGHYLLLALAAVFLLLATVLGITSLKYN